MLLIKPLSAAIAIGTGGPFGAEGPIIATGKNRQKTILINKKVLLWALLLASLQKLFLVNEKL